jgi:hypothetical protein
MKSHREVALNEQLQIVGRKVIQNEHLQKNGEGEGTIASRVGRVLEF